MTVFSDDEILAEFYIGYDLDYCGAALHCSPCGEGVDFPLFINNGVEVLGNDVFGDTSLADIVTAARLHWQEHHA